MSDTQPFPTRQAATEAFASHVSRGKAEFYQTIGLDVVMGGRQGVALGSSHDGAGHIEVGRHRVAAGNHELGRRRESGREGIDPGLEGVDHLRADTGGAGRCHR